MISKENKHLNYSEEVITIHSYKKVRPPFTINKENLQPLSNISNLPGINVIYNCPKEIKPNLIKVKILKAKRKKITPHPTNKNYFIPPRKERAPHISKMELKFVGNPQYLTDYSSEIFKNLKEQELINNPNYEVLQQNQKEITENAREILINWLTQVQFKFELLTETLFLTINIIDRYIEKNENFPLKKYQLVGMASMLIASKYEEIYPPEVRDFVHITKGAITSEDILNMEYKIMVALDFEVLTVSPYVFMQRYSFIAGNTEEGFYLSQMLLELMNRNINVMKFPNSLRAACAVYLSRKILKGERKITGELWNFELKFYTGYDVKDMTDIIKANSVMFKKLVKDYKKGKENATIDKFKYIQYYNVSEYLFE